MLGLESLEILVTFVVFSKTNRSMPHYIGNTIADSLRLSLKYAEVLLADVQSETFGRFAVADGKAIESNHPAFIYGHLSLYAHRIMTELGNPVDDVPLAFADHFSKDAICKDDVEETLPDMQTITDYFFNSWQEVHDVLRATDDETFLQPTLSEGMKERFPTLGSLHNFYASGHNMMHLGQMSAWRRMMGLGSA